MSNYYSDILYTWTCTLLGVVEAIDCILITVEPLIVDSNSKIGTLYAIKDIPKIIFPVVFTSNTLRTSKRGQPLYKDTTAVVRSQHVLYSEVPL